MLFGGIMLEELERILTRQGGIEEEPVHNNLPGHHGEQTASVRARTETLPSSLLASHTAYSAQTAAGS